MITMGKLWADKYESTVVETIIEDELVGPKPRLSAQDDPNWFTVVTMPVKEAGATCYIYSDTPIPGLMAIAHNVEVTEIGYIV